MKQRALFGILALAGAVAACSDAGGAPLLPAGPSYGGGHTIGSGAGAPGDSGQMDTASTDSTGRGGHTLGSGA